MERRQYSTEEEKLAKLPGIRDYSRQAYLKKREEQKLEEMRDAIEDERALFAVSIAPLATARLCTRLCQSRILMDRGPCAPEVTSGHAQHGIITA